MQLSIMTLCSKKMKNLGQMLNETGYHDYCHKPGLPQAKHGVQSF